MLDKTSRYIRYDHATRTYELRTPTAVVRWPQAFRERLVRDFRYPQSGMSIMEYDSYKEYMETGSWNISAAIVRFLITHLTHTNGRLIPITSLHANKRSKVLILDHPNPIIRSLMCHSFLTKEEIIGLPNMKLLDSSVMLEAASAHRKKKTT